MLIIATHTQQVAVALALEEGILFKLVGSVVERVDEEASWTDGSRGRLGARGEGRQNWGTGRLGMDIGASPWGNR
jgi:hypothetical protein